MKSTDIEIFCPIYNNARFIEKIDRNLIEIEKHCGTILPITFFDNESQDEPQKWVQSMQFLHRRYFDLGPKFGIDNAIADMMQHADAEYIWMFGDDTLDTTLVSKVTQQIQDSRPDIVLVGRKLSKRSKEIVWPGFAEAEFFQFFSSDQSKVDFFSSHTKLEFFFSFISSIIIRPSVWHSLPDDKRFFGSCYSHSVKILKLLQSHSLLVVNAPLVIADLNNDSFRGSGFTKRILLDLKAFSQFLDEVPHYADHIKRAIYNEHCGLNRYVAIIKCHSNHDLNLLLNYYKLFSLENLATRFLAKIRAQLNNGKSYF